jgi:hypothetical protein
MKLENGPKHGAIMWFFACGSELRARWHDWIIDSCRAGKNLKECIQMLFLLKVSVKLIYHSASNILLRVVGLFKFKITKILQKQPARFGSR